MSILFEELWQQEVKPHPEYVAGGVLGKGQVMILAAPVWSMKSVVALNMAHQLASGLGFLSTFATPMPCNVLFLDNEIGLTYFQERLKLFYPDTSDLPKGKIRLCSREHESTQFHIDSKSTLDPLREAIEAHQANVVIMDCLNPFLSDEEGEQTFSRTANNVSMLQREYDELGLSFIILHHMREIQQGVDPLSWYNIRGHGKLVDWPATRIMMARNKNKSGSGDRLTLRFMLRHGPNVDDLVLIPDLKTLRVSAPTGIVGLGD